MKVKLGVLRRLIREEMEMVSEEQGSILSTGTVKPEDIAKAFDLDPKKTRDAMTRMKSAGKDKHVDPESLDSTTRKKLTHLGANLLDADREKLGQIITVIKKAEASGGH